MEEIDAMFTIAFLPWELDVYKRQGHDHIRLLALVVGGPLPDTQALGAVLDGLLHGEVLHSRVLGGHDHIDIVAAADTVVKTAEQAVGIGRQVQPHHIGGLVGNMVPKAGVLMGKAIVVLGPDGGSQNDVEGGDVLDVYKRQGQWSS